MSAVRTRSGATARNIEENINKHLFSLFIFDGVLIKHLFSLINTTSVIEHLFSSITVHYLSS